MENRKELQEGTEEFATINSLRGEREYDCFRIINRGKLWYDKLTEQQKKELQEWYEAWLDVTDTLTKPAKPDWIK